MRSYPTTVPQTYSPHNLCHHTKHWWNLKNKKNCILPLCHHVQIGSGAH